MTNKLFITKINDKRKHNNNDNTNSKNICFLYVSIYSYKIIQTFIQIIIKKLFIISLIIYLKTFLI